MASTSTIRSFGLREASTLAGHAATQILANASAARTGIEIHNASSSLSLWVRAIERGSPAPTISTTDRDYVIAPLATLALQFGPGIDIYLQNSSGAATNSAYTAREVLA